MTKDKPKTKDSKNTKPKIVTKCVKDEWQKDQRDNMPQPSNICVNDEWQKSKWDNMPLPKKKIGTWQEHEQSKPNVLQNQPLKAYGPTEKLPAEQSPGHHHRKMPRITIFPRQKVADVLQGKGAENDQVAVVPPKIMTKEDAARPDQVAVAPA